MEGCCVWVHEVVESAEKMIGKDITSGYSFLHFILTICPFSEEFSESGGSLKEKNNVLFSSHM